MHQRLARIAAEIHADGIVDRRDAASAMPGHGQRLLEPNTEENRIAPCEGGCGAGAGGTGGGRRGCGGWAAAGGGAIVGRALLRGGARRRGRIGRGRGNRGAGAAAVLARRHPLEFLAQRPFRFFGGDLHAFDQRGVLGFAPMRLHVAVAIGVEDAELHRVHADEMGELVHLAFDREIHRGDAEAAHRGRRRAVGEDAIDVAVDVRDRIGPGQMRRAFDHGVARQPRIGAAVEIGAHLARDDAAVAHDAVLQVDALGAARRTVLHLLLAAEHVAHRAAGQHRAEDGKRLGQGIDLAAEAAADGAADEMKGVGGHVEDLGAGVEREEQRLRRGVDDIASVGVGRRDRAVGLGRRVLDRRHLIALLEHMVGARRSRARRRRSAASDDRRCRDR